MGGSPAHLDGMIIPLIQGPRILDVGCGFGKWGYLCTVNYWETHNPLPAPSRPEIMGCDGYLPNIEMASRTGVYAGVLQVIFPPLPFKDLSYDTVLVLDVIEHLRDDQAIKLVEEAKRIARHRVIISTPNHRAYREAHETITGLNDLDAHISYFNREWLKKLGFELFGAGWTSGSGRWRFLLRQLGLINWYDERVRHYLSGLSLLFPFAVETIVGLWVRGNSK